LRKRSGNPRQELWPHGAESWCNVAQAAGYAYVLYMDISTVWAIAMI